jgi:metallo-beta-lactamase family protein
MKIYFHGAARTVTGSKHLIETGSGKQILLDCGMFQGHGTDADRLNRHFGFDPASVDVLLVSHAHIDHSGLIPLLVKQGFRGDIYCTPATRDLMEIMLLDSASIQESDIKHINKRRKIQGKTLLTPLYTEENVVQAMKLVREVNYDTETELFNDCRFMFTDVGHIVGSAAVHVAVTEKGKETRITFSGDIGRYGQEILRDPQPFGQADYILCESTYGNELHEPEENPDEELLHHIEETCIRKGGKLIIPAFSVGRTQELLYKLNHLFLEHRLPHINYFVDSPLSRKATRVMREHTNLYNKEVKKLMQHDDDPFDFPYLTFIDDAEESKALNSSNEPSVIISASGMADAGRVKHHIAQNIGKPEATILIVGYCEPDSLGGRLMRGAREVKIFGEEYHVNCSVKVMKSISAHGDYRDMIRFLFCQNPRDVKTVFLVHGEYEEQIVFRERLQEAGFRDVDIPELHAGIELH